MIRYYHYLLHRKNPYVEHYDVVKVNEYMDLDNLAKVLEELVNKYSGMFVDVFSYTYFDMYVHM